MPNSHRLCAAALLLVSAIVLPAGAQSPEAVNLQPKVRQGQVTRYELWTRRDQAVTIVVNNDRQSFSSGMEVTGETSWSVDRVMPDGSSQCTMTLDWLAVTVTLPDGVRQDNDSRRATGQTESVHQLVRAMAGVPIRVDVAADGSIRSVSGVDAIRRRAGADMRVPDELDFVESANDLAFIAAAPASAVVGQSWQVPYTWNHEIGKLHQAMRYQLASVEEIAGIGVATVTGVAKLRLEPDMSKFPKEGPRVDVRLTGGSYDTQIMFDLQRGEAVGRNATQQLNVDIRMRMGDRSLNQTLTETTQSQALRIEER